MKYVIGVDIGGTNIRGGVVLGGKIIKKAELPTQANKGKWTVVKNILEVIKELFSKDVKAIGVGAPGALDIEKGMVTNSPNLPLNGVMLVRIIKREFKVPVFLDNDASCFVLGEAMYGAGKRYSHVAGLTLGTGVGGGIVIDKKIYHGKGNAGELGHVFINFDGPICSCRVKGDLESYVSAKGVKRLTGLTPVQLYGKALAGDRKAIKAFEDYGFYLGVGICNIISSLDPEIVIIGGRITGAWRFFSKKMKSAVGDLEFNEGVKIVRSELEEPGILGAASLVK